MKVIKKLYTKEKEVVGDKEIWRDVETKLSVDAIDGMGYNIDGGRPDTNYGGIDPIVGGGVDGS